MSDFDALVRGVLESLDGAGALADWLQEHDREKEAVLLRRRMKAWERDRRMAVESMRSAKEDIERPMLDAVATLRAAGFAVEAQIHARPADLTPEVDEKFRAYIRERFAGVRPEQVPMWALDRNGVGHAVAGGTALMPLTACGVMGNGFTLHAGLPRGGKIPRGTCAKCKTRLQTARLKPEGAA